MKMVARAAAAYASWTDVEVSDHYTLDYMATALRASPYSPEWNTHDCGFTSEIAEQLFGRPGQSLEVWDSDFMSYECGVLAFQIAYSYFPDRGDTIRKTIRIVESN
jgi:hypothetical protein